MVGPNAWLQRKVHLRPQHRGVHLVTEEILRGVSYSYIAYKYVSIVHIYSSKFLLITCYQKSRLISFFLVLIRNFFNFNPNMRFNPVALIFG